MKINVIIGAKKGAFDATSGCINDISLTSYRQGKASELIFTVMRNVGTFGEGDCVQLLINDEVIFQGFVFTKERDKNHFIKVTAYDQLRYLKNKDTYNYTYKKASDVVMMIVNDFKLKYGAIDNSKYVIAKRLDENKTLFDIILNACDITYKNTGNRFILFDKGGRLYFRNEKDLKLDFSIAINDGSLIDFNCKTDINEDTYSKVKVFQKDDRKKIYKSYLYENSDGISNFGVLQYFEKLPTEYNEFQVKSYAQNILKEKCRVKRNLSIKCLGLGQGEHNIRAGNSIFIDKLDIGEELLNGYYVITKCKHSFENNLHTIEIEF